jgi:hypothetical protein
MGGTKITGIGDFSISQPLVQICVAAAAKLLFGILHRPGTLMLGMAFNAATFGAVEFICNLAGYFAVPFKRRFGQF